MIKDTVFCILFVIIFNILIIHSGKFFRCDEISINNVLKTNLICNGINSVTYHIINYQLELYSLILIYFTKNIKETFEKILVKINNFENFNFCNFEYFMTKPKLN